MDVDGRHYRFPALPPPRPTETARPELWASNFILPAWLAPRLAGHTVLRIGELKVEVHDLPPSTNGSGSSHVQDEGEGDVMAELRPGDSAEADDPIAGPQASVRADHPAAGDGVDVPEQPAGNDVTAVLRAELKERASAQAHIQGELADVRAELDARVANQERLRATHDQLRTELERLSALVRQKDTQRAEVESRAVVLAAELSDAQAQVADLGSVREGLMAERDVLIHEVANLRAALAAGIVTSDAATAEAEGLREELQRLGSELARAREAIGNRDSGLDEAEVLLGEARALTASLREP